VDDWRDTALAELGQMLFDRVNISNTVASLEVQRDATNHLWRLIRPMSARADNQRINLALQKLNTTRVTKFITDDPKVDLDLFGLNSPELELRFAQDTNVLATYQFGRSPTNDSTLVFARRVGFNTVVTTGQTVIGEALRCALELAFEMDELLWPMEKKTIRGTSQGTPFEETYQAKRDINGDYTADVTYGFAAGQDPARAIVGLLQLRGDQLISRDFFQRQLPMGIDVVQMQTQIDNEQFTDALKQGMMGYMQAIPQMALQGQDPLDALRKIAKLIELREKGEPVHDAVLRIFTPKEAPPGASPQNPLEAAVGGPQGQAGAPGQPAPPGASQQPQGIDMMTLLSGLTDGGKAQMTARTQRQSPLQ
jgi:hypothetical protein